MPTVNSVVTPDTILRLITLAGGDGGFPPHQTTLQVVFVNAFLPLPARRLTLFAARVLEPALVEVVRIAGRIRCPDKMRYRVGQKFEEGAG